MERLWTFFVRKSAFTLLILIAVSIFGTASILTIPRESNPEVVVPIVVIATALPGASAADVENLITDKIEEALNRGLEEVKKITSTSRENLSSVIVEFNATADIDTALQDVKDEVDLVKNELPQDATDPNITKIDFQNQPVLLAAVSSELPITQFIQLTDDLIDELESIPGVASVQKSGIRDREIQVIVRQESLKTYNLRLMDIIWAIQAANNALPVGSLQVNGSEYAVRFKGDISHPSELSSIAVLNSSGQPVYLRDVAFISNGVSKNNSISRVSIDGSDPLQAASLSIFKKSGADITRISTSVKEKLTELKPTLLSDAQVLISFDVGEFITKDLKNLTFTALQTILLVMIILFLALGWRESLIAGLAIPLSFLIAFIGLNATDNTINFISLFSLILAVGILVDSTIVMVEGIHARIKHFPKKSDAAIATIKEFHWPLTSGTMTTIAVFAPLFLISGIVGEFIKSIPYTLIFVLLASLFVALALIPLATVVLLSKKERRASRLQSKRTQYTDALKNWYKTRLDNFIGYRKKERRFYFAVILIFVISLTLPISGAVKTIFFPPEDTEFIYIEIENPEGTVLGETDLTTRAVEEILLQDNRIESFITTVGAPSFFSTDGFVSETGGSGRIANITVTLKDREIQNSNAIVNDLRQKVATINNTEIRVSQPNSGPPTGSPITLRFLGEDLAQLEKTAVRGAQVLQDISGTVNVQTGVSQDSAEFVLTVDRAKASELGLSAASIAQILRTSIVGQTATTIKTPQEDIDVEVKLDLNPRFITPHDTTRATLDQVMHLEIQTPSGPVLLGSIVASSIQKSAASINHEDLSRVITVTSDLQEGAITADVLAQFNQKTADPNSSFLPEGVEMKIGGEQEEIDQSFQDMFTSLIIGIVLILAILVLQFNSYRQAWIIVIIVPVTLIGIFFGLLITDKTLSFPSILGFIALSGIVVNNSIILIDRMNNIRKNHPHMNLKQVVIEGASSRLRPILLTTLTTVIGMIPLTYASELWSPLAFAIIFGLSFAVLVTLWLVPTMYYRRYAKRG